MKKPHLKIRLDDPAALEQMIDRLMALRAGRKARADDLDSKADAYFKKFGDDLPMEQKSPLGRKRLATAVKFRNTAKRLRAMAVGVDDQRMKCLSAKLAELRTGIFPGMLPDGSVEVRR